MGRRPHPSYERLEFLGDSVLELAIARTLFDRFPEFTEGRMAKVALARRLAGELCGRRARARARRAAARPRRRAPPDEVDRLARNRNVLAALLEAALAALYLEHGFEAIEPAIVEAFEPRIEYALNVARRPQDRAAGAARAHRPLRVTTRP